MLLTKEDNITFDVLVLAGKRIANDQVMCRLTNFLLYNIYTQWLHVLTCLTFVGFFGISRSDAFISKRSDAHAWSSGVTRKENNLGRHAMFIAMAEKKTGASSVHTHIRAAIYRSTLLASFRRGGRARRWGRVRLAAHRKLLPRLINYQCKHKRKTMYRLNVSNKTLKVT